MSSSFRDLRVWQEAMRLSVETYRMTAGFPKNEIYGLAQQMRRAAVSVPSNVAEGKGRHTNREFAQFLFHARGSLLELETQILIARELQYLSVQQAHKLQENATKAGRSLAGLINAVRATVDSKPTTEDRQPTTNHV
jgi:four helix bundle protein